MARCRVDQSIQRVEMSGFAFPLGVYPVEEMQPKQGYTSAFEPADGDDGGGEWEEWPDRYVYDILVPATRLEALCRALLAMLPGRIYPILDFLGQDEWREVDPYVSYDLLGQDRFLDGLRRFAGYFYEDGLVGFGAMSEEPFLYVFVDEHKVVTVRAESNLKDKVEGVLAAFDLEQLEEILSADQVTHEHRAVLETPDDRPDLLTEEEIVEVLRDEWRLVLNIDPETNVDEEGNDLGMTGWRCIVRYEPADPKAAAANGEEGEAKPDGESAGKSEAEPKAAEAKVEPPPVRYAQIFLTADSLSRATELTLEGLVQLLVKDGVAVPEDDEGFEPVIVQSDRWGEKDFVREVEAATGQIPEITDSSVKHASWLN